MSYLDIELVDVNFNGNGVQNCGSSCFFNSLNQMLFHIVEFREFIIRHEYLFTDNKIIYNLIGLFKKMKEGNIISSDDIIDSVNAKTLSNFYLDIQESYFGARYGKQQDSGELFLYYISGTQNFDNIISINQSINNKDIKIYNNITNNTEFNGYFNKFNINFPLYDFIYKISETKTCVNEKPIKINEEKITYDYVLRIDYTNNKSINILGEKTEVELGDIKKNDLFCENSVQMIKTTDYFFGKYVIVHIKRDNQGVFQLFNFYTIKIFKKRKNEETGIETEDLINDFYIDYLNSAMKYDRYNYNEYNQYEFEYKTVEEQLYLVKFNNTVYNNYLLGLNFRLYFTDPDTNTLVCLQDLTPELRNSYNLKAFYTPIKIQCPQKIIEYDQYFTDLITGEQLIYSHLSYEDRTKYAIDGILEYGPIENWPKTNDILKINDSFGHQYNLIGTICKFGPPNGGHWWYHHYFGGVWNEYNDSSFSANSPPDQNQIIFALFRLNDAPYRIPIYRNVEEISNHALIMAYQYINTEMIEKQTKIEQYIRILVYYVAKINHLEKNPLLNQVKQHFIDLLKSLLT